jgi:AsmA protein
VRASGSGAANLAQETIDYRLQVTVAEAAGRAGATLPLRIGGTFAAPEYRVDFSALLKEKATKPLEQKLEQKKGEAADKLRNRLLDKLRR